MRNLVKKCKGVIYLDNNEKNEILFLKYCFVQACLFCCVILKQDRLVIELDFINIFWFFFAIGH